MYNIITFTDNLISTDTFLFKFDVYVYIATLNHTKFLASRKNTLIDKFFILLIGYFKKLMKRISFAIYR